MARRNIQADMKEGMFKAAVDDAVRTMKELKPESALLQNLGKTKRDWDAYIDKFALFKENATYVEGEEYPMYYMSHVRKHVQEAQEYGVDPKRIAHLLSILPACS